MEDDKGFWARHHITTRLLSLVIMYGYALSVHRDKVNPEVVSTTGWLVFFALLVLTFGINAMDKVIELVKAWKGIK